MIDELMRLIEPRQKTLLALPFVIWLYILYSQGIGFIYLTFIVTAISGIMLGRSYIKRSKLDRKTRKILDSYDKSWISLIFFLLFMSTILIGLLVLGTILISSKDNPSVSISTYWNVYFVGYLLFWVATLQLFSLLGAGLHIWLFEMYKWFVKKRESAK